MSFHELAMGRSSKQEALDELAAFYRQNGWTQDTSSDKFVAFEPPETATSEEIAAVHRGADLIAARYNLGVS